uniref:Putative secreted peptide n=1 Tax=Anopheles braziliensis TaxID=58242 RepID=A0A2M3ZVV5_9DIPT
MALVAAVIVFDWATICGVCGREEAEFPPRTMADGTGEADVSVGGPEDGPPPPPVADGVDEVVEGAAVVPVALAPAADGEAERAFTTP